MRKHLDPDRHVRFIVINLLIAGAAFGILIHTPVGYQLLIAG
ncbi:MAG: hypothetical protein JWO15_3924 [Sphingomonadales bacterium]|nr:hypothetical protein [Sphingomonadales bacterium]